MDYQDWHTMLYYTQLLIITTYSTPIDNTPFHVMFGWTPDYPFDSVCGPKTVITELPGGRTPLSCYQSV
jgi:hypothetical protein